MRQILVLVLVCGCEQSTPPSSPATAPVSATPPAAVRPAVRAAAVSGFTIQPVTTAQGENGAGVQVAATNPVAIDVTAEAWPGRALDPVLWIGRLHFHEYSFPAQGVIRWIVADAALIPDGAPIAVQYGDDAGSRVVVRP